MPLFLDRLLVTGSSRSPTSAISQAAPTLYASRFASDASRLLQSP